MLLTVGITASAQEALDSRHTIVSPEIHDDNRVTFRLKTPDHVASVRVGSDCFSSGGADLKKNAEGIWEYTTPEPLPSELYSYFYVVDGMMMLDPSNVYIVRDVSTTMNIFIIGGGIGDLYKVNAVPHGTVSRVWYDSPSLQMKRRLSVYTPAGYDPGSKRKYPVLYLLHGMGGDEEAWLTLGRVAQIMDNLIAARKAHPMIVVMPNGNVAQEAAPGESALGLVPPTPYLPKTMEGTFESTFPDIVQYVDTHYRTSRKKSHRAICGLSMGGFHAKFISARYPDMFDYIGLFSAAVAPGEKVHSEVYENMELKLKNSSIPPPNYIGYPSVKMISCTVQTSITGNTFLSTTILILGSRQKAVILGEIGVTIFPGLFRKYLNDCRQTGNFRYEQVRQDHFVASVSIIRKCIRKDKTSSYILIINMLCI